MSEIIRLIQRQVSLDDYVIFTLKTGKEVEGVLMELSRNHVLLEKDGKSITVLLEMIGSWEVCQEQDQPITQTVEKQNDVIKLENETSINSNNNTKILESITKIESCFSDQIQTVKIELKDPDFICQKELSLAIKNIWDSIKQKYDYAKKTKELGVTYGRIQHILEDFKRLEKLAPNSPDIKRHLAYIYYLNNNENDALNYYKQAAYLSQQTIDWFNVAVLSLSSQPELACYSLENYFKYASPNVEKKTWYLYIPLVQKFSNYIAIVKLLENGERNFTDEDINILLETGIYLLKAENKDQLITKYTEKLLAQRSLRSAAIELFCQFDDKTTESFNQSIQKFKFEADEVKRKFIVIPKIAITQNISFNHNKPIKPTSKTKQSLPPLPRGHNPYAKAKRMREIEKDLPKAVELYKQAIEQKDNLESSVKDLASLYAQIDKTSEAIKILQEYRDQFSNQQSIDNMLINLYQKAEMYKEAIQLLDKVMKSIPHSQQKAQLRWQRAYCEMKRENFPEAEQQFYAVLKTQPNNVTVKRNLAICLFKQKLFIKAKQMLEEILSVYPNDYKTEELYKLVNHVTETGYSPAIDSEISKAISNYADEISTFARFFLTKCSFQGIAPNKISNEETKTIYIGSDKDRKFDVTALEELAKSAKTRLASERAEYYLSAANIIEIENPNQFYQYLCRSFASKGDAAIATKKHLDSARELYCETLNIYDDGYLNSEQDAINALGRFLYSYLSLESIPTQQVRGIDNAVEETVNASPKEVFNAITYLICRSDYAAKRVLTSLFNNKYLKDKALSYLNKKGTHKAEAAAFASLWDNLRNEKRQNIFHVSNELRVIQDTFELTTAKLEDAIIKCEQLIGSDKLFFDLDKQQITALQHILEISIDLCTKSIFEDQEQLCIKIRNSCDDLLKKIENNPTKISIESIYPIIETIQTNIKKRLKELYKTSVPQLEIRLAQEMESYIPDSDKRIEIQIVITNKTGCSPAESLELIVRKDTDLISAIHSEIKINSSLRGGDSQTLAIPLRVFKSAIEAQTFSLSIYAKYRTRSEEIFETPIENLSIRLYSEEDFEEIDNPYSAYAQGGVVSKEMFYGRDELINNIANAINNSKEQSKCVVIFGQKRAGKSSTLAHLKSLLQANPNHLILDIGNIGSIIDQNTSTAFVYQILWGILIKLKYAIEDKIDSGFQELDVSFPEDGKFYTHPSPLASFKEILDNYKRKANKLDEWKDLRIILLIDEFSYIYEQILNNRIPDNFMKNWKALLQENYFNAVLVGQDVMTKFKQKFPNEFGTTQDERVTYLKEEDARKLIDEPIRIGGKQGKSRYVERAIDKIVDLTAGSPFYIQIVCNRLVDYMNSRRAKFVSDADIEKIKSELIRGVNALDLDKFDNLINSGDTSADAIKDEDTIKVLNEIAKHSQTTDKCNRNNITCNTERSIDYILDDLVKRDVLECTNHYYRIRVGLFKEWLLVH